MNGRTHEYIIIQSLFNTPSYSDHGYCLHVILLSWIMNVNCFVIDSLKKSVTTQSTQYLESSIWSKPLWDHIGHYYVADIWTHKSPHTKSLPLSIQLVTISAYDYIVYCKLRQWWSMIGWWSMVQWWFMIAHMIIHKITSWITMS